MRIQLLISAQNKTIDWANIKFRSNYNLIINQVNAVEFFYDSFNFKSYFETGLSRSRNRLLQNACGDICVICDEDVNVSSDYYDTINKAYEDIPDADIITFQILTPDNLEYKNYSKSIFKHNHFTILRVSSIEITFKFSAIKNFNLKFDERFGLGSIYPGGEENIFLKDAIDAGLNVYYYPKPITIHPQESSNKIINKDFFFIKGAILKRIYGRLGIPIAFIFFIFQLRKIKRVRCIFKYFYSFLIGWFSLNK